MTSLTDKMRDLVREVYPDVREVKVTPVDNENFNLHLIRSCPATTATGIQCTRSKYHEGDHITTQTADGCTLHWSEVYN